MLDSVSSIATLPSSTDQLDSAEASNCHGPGSIGFIEASTRHLSRKEDLASQSWHWQHCSPSQLGGLELPGFPLLGGSR